MIALIAGGASTSAVAAPAADPSPETSETRVSVLPIGASAGLSRHVAEDMNDQVAVGFTRAGFQTSTPAQVSAASQRADQCASAECYREISSATHATHLVRSRVAVARNDYQMALELISGRDGQVLVTVEDTCEVCGNSEAVAVMANLAASVASKLEGLLQPAVLTLVSDPPDARAFIDGAELGRTPLEIEVTAGTHELSLKKEGFAPQTRELEFSGGVHQRLSVGLVPLEPDRRPEIPAWAGWSLVGVGAAATISGITLLAVDERPIRSNCSGENVDDAGNCKFRQNTLPAGAALTAIGLAAAAAGTALLIVRRKRHGRRARGHAFVHPTRNGLRVRF